ncbi:hypothetical protein ATKI12_8864 [Kitasatospora sp. Ki12]
MSLVLVDEIHRLNPHTTGGAEPADFLKDLSERLPAIREHLRRRGIRRALSRPRPPAAPQPGR